ncbi:hypothetical protein C8J56DRAFT_1045087 [Mycena floridula]|nr:hypothetical protein C8J56DRAFT_1045087 [Mycena floridula]
MCFLCASRRIPFEIWTKIFALSETEDLDKLRLTENIKIELDEERSEFIESFIRSRKRYCGDIPLSVEISFPEAPRVDPDDSEDEQVVEERQEEESRIPALSQLLQKVLDGFKPTMSKLHLFRFHEIWRDVIAPIQLGSTRLTSFAITPLPGGTDAKSHTSGSWTFYLGDVLALGSTPDSEPAEQLLVVHSPIARASSESHLNHISRLVPPKRDKSFYPTFPLRAEGPLYSSPARHSFLEIRAYPACSGAIQVDHFSAITFERVLVEDFAPFLLRSACSLHTPELDGPRLDDNTLLDILGQVLTSRSSTLLHSLAGGISR